MKKTRLSLSLSSNSANILSLIFKDNSFKRQQTKLGLCKVQKEMGCKQKLWNRKKIAIDFFLSSWKKKTKKTAKNSLRKIFSFTLNIFAVSTFIFFSSYRFRASLISLLKTPAGLVQWAHALELNGEDRKRAGAGSALLLDLKPVLYEHESTPTRTSDIWRSLVSNDLSHTYTHFLSVFGRLNSLTSFPK